LKNRLNGDLFATNTIILYFTLLILLEFKYSYFFNFMPQNLLNAFPYFHGKIWITVCTKQDILTWPGWCRTAWHDWLDAGYV